MKRRMYLLNFIEKFCEGRYVVVWCEDFSNTLYDLQDLFEASQSDSPLTIFDCMLVDDICVNGNAIQINCSFNNKKWNKKALYYSEHLDELPVFESEVNE